MQVQGCKGKAKLAVLALELLTLDVSQPTSSTRAARALQLQREASISAAFPRNRRRYLAYGEGTDTGGGLLQLERLEGRTGSRWHHQHPISRPYSASAVATVEASDQQIADYAAPPTYHHESVTPTRRIAGGGPRGSINREATAEPSEEEHTAHGDLSGLVNDLESTKPIPFDVVEVMHRFLSMPDRLKLALSTSELLETFSILDKAVLEERDNQSMSIIQSGLDRIPMPSLLEGFARSREDAEQQNAIIALWMKVLVNAEMPDLADHLFESATSRGLLSTLDTDLVVGPLVILREWSLILKWTRGRVCSVGVHAMRMRALIALGQPQLALADYKEYLQQLGTERSILVEAMKSYYMTRDFTNGNRLRKDLAQGHWTRTSEYALAQIQILRYLGFTPLLEKAILGDLRRHGSTFRHVPLLNVLLSQRIENKLDISPILAMYPRSRVPAPPASSHTVVLDEHTLALLIEDRRDIQDQAQLLDTWQHIQSHLLDQPISSRLVAALIKALLRLDLADDAAHLLQDIVNQKNNIWIDRPLRNYSLQRDIESSSNVTETHLQLSTLLKYKPSKYSRIDGLSVRMEDLLRTPEVRKGPSSETIFSAAMANGFELDVGCCEEILRLYVAKADLAGAQELMGLSWQMGMIPSMEMWTIFVKGILAQDSLQSFALLSFEARMQFLRQVAERWRPATVAAAKSMTLAALTPDQATYTRIIKALMNEGALRPAVRVWTYARTSMAQANQTPDVGLLTVAFEALLRTGQTNKATELLSEAPAGYAGILRSAQGTAKIVLRKALKRARAWHAKQQDDWVARVVDDFLKSMSSAALPNDRSWIELDAEGKEMPAAGPAKHVKRSGFAQGELIDLRRQILTMFNELWPEEGSRTDV
ncbi:hypothetical protein QFC21_003723 [Naganishia friedmannii]|uniref:Uncharacterized protein n=1 Tax=Naganishia friedmannii TaxID=89922 RepID=A0ACC2VND4_9TREE|nr:hypothetical protein QFC21_003723 [Naganishia friedmannii]